MKLPVSNVNQQIFSAMTVTVEMKSNQKCGGIFGVTALPITIQISWKTACCICWWISSKIRGSSFRREAKMGIAQACVVRNDLCHIFCYFEFQIHIYPTLQAFSEQRLSRSYVIIKQS